MKNTTWKIKEIIAHYNDYELFVDKEYQRSVVWSKEQKQKLIDSILRKFPIPLIILQKNNDRYNIIDGQQRLDSILRFYLKEDFKLLSKSSFPLHNNNNDSWYGKNYHNLDNLNKEQFLNYEVQVIILEGGYSINEFRDIFIRLQSGSPLNHQEKMDSYPGQFNEFILTMAGKEMNAMANLIPNDYNDADYTGYEFFTDMVKSTKTDRGKVRKLCADIYLLYKEFLTEAKITGLSNSKNEAYYINKLEFDKDDESLSCFFKEIIKDLEKIEEFNFINSKDKLDNWEAIHLVLFSIPCKYFEFKGWKNKIGTAAIHFRNELEKKDISDELSEFKNLIKTDANSAKTINRRMKIYTKYMWEFMYQDKTNYFELAENINKELDFYKYRGITVANLNQYIKLQIDIQEKIIFLPIDTDEDEKEGSPTHLITKIKAFYKNGDLKEYKNPQQAHKNIFPETAHKSLNRPGLIFGTKDNKLKVNEVFWKLIDKLEFTMNAKRYIVSRNDFDDYWEERYKQ